MDIPANHRAFLSDLARRAMVERGFEPDFSSHARAEVARLTAAAAPGGAHPSGAPAAPPATPDRMYAAGRRDLRKLLWCSIDNDDSRDLDQLTVAEALPDGSAKILVAVADVSERVADNSAVNEHAETNTTSIYTPAEIFPMLPEELSTDLTSLNPSVDRGAMVVEMTVDAGGTVVRSTVYPALVHNYAKLAYRSVGAWLEGEGPMPDAIERVPGLADNLRVQDRVAQQLQARRHEMGALQLQTIEARAQFDGDAITGLASDDRNRAKEIIADFMIAANGVVARFLEAKRFPVMRRVVRSPERWQRIMDIADDYGTELPADPDARALNEFLLARRAADPLRFPDLSLSVIKLLGRGEYVASAAGESVDGHFGLALSDYTHSTAPNRRYPDLITQRLLKAALVGDPSPYSPEEMDDLARHCTMKENDAQKVERLMRKAAAACLLASERGREFDGLITGASPKGTWVRIFDPPVEGRVEEGASGLDVGDRVRVRLIHTDPERGFIDFARVSHARVGRRR